VTKPRVTIGIPTYEDYTGLWATLVDLRKAIVRNNLNELVELVVCDNQPDYAGGWIEQRVRSNYFGRYLPLKEPTSTGAPRNLIMKEALGEITIVMDSHVTQYDYDQLPRVVNYLLDNAGDELFFGVCLSDSIVDKHGKIKPVWTHWKPEFGRDGLFGRSQVSQDIMNSPRPVQIQHSGAGLFAARTSTFLGFHPEQAGFGAEGWLTLRYLEMRRKVMVIPWWRWNHCFRPHGDTARGVRTPYDARWTSRGLNYLRYVRDLQPNPYMTYAGVKAAHVQPGRISATTWDLLLGRVGCTDAGLAARDLLISTPAVTEPASLIDPLNQPGPGVELERLLMQTAGGVTPTVRKYLRLMNLWGSQRCDANFDTLVSWLQVEPATVRTAIERARHAGT